MHFPTEKSTAMRAAADVNGTTVPAPVHDSTSAAQGLCHIIPNDAFEPRMARMTRINPDENQSAEPSTGRVTE